MRLTGVVFATSALVLALAIAGEAAPPEPTTPPPPTLVGESLGNRGSSGTAIGRCDPGHTSRLRWDVTGAATGFFDLAGPYPGTFHQVGNAVFGALVAGFEFPLGPLRSYTSGFEIDSAVGRVTGTVILATRGERPPPLGTAFGGCDGDPLFFAVVVSEGAARYRALIRTAEWLCQTAGSAAATVNAIPPAVANVDVAFVTVDRFRCHAR
jgi:hypothetical protein